MSSANTTSTSTQREQISPPPRGATATATAADDLALFHFTLARACRAGVPLPGPLRALGDELRRPSVKAAAHALYEDLEAGAPFAEAYGRHDGVFPPLYRNLVEAGMACSDLPGVLEDLGTDAHQRACTRSRLRQALARPTVSLVAVLLVGTAAMCMAVPALAIVVEPGVHYLGEPEPSVFSFLVRWAGPILGVGLLVAIAAVTRWGRPADGVRSRSTSLRLPVVGPLRTLAAKASFARTLALLLRRHTPLDQALTLTAAATDDRGLRAEVETMARRAREGGSLRQSLGAGALLPDSMLWFVEGAESEPERGLADIAAVYQQRLEHRLDRTTLFLTPLAELLVGIIVLLFAVRLLAPSLGTFHWIGGF